ncbi:CwfJ C-terminus 1-domain-containing protein-like protein [Apodospora peruviana]|uniref:CwfJ C-terminus 1-domain-containing protein-like protein n=1 Tax=Apodospora peruviana TaxID=516989 RepID=A0AAE0IR84_9PEZI|nr:CwfJ C-terminus 1-domain-containing protein-like protein [Apodospora peruviana]
MAAKIFVFGSVNGQLKSAFAKLAAAHAKNSFTFAIVTGNLFATGIPHPHDSLDDEEDMENQLKALLNGEITVPCPTYFTVGKVAMPALVVDRLKKDEDVAPNLHFLGKRSVTNTTSGIRIATLGGKLDKTAKGLSTDEFSPTHTPDDAKALKGANRADILLTAMWATEIWNNSPKAQWVQIDPEDAIYYNHTSQGIAELYAALKPRYHFAASPTGIFYEREPFYYGVAELDPEEGHPIRFVSMAPWRNESKAKSMYAFTLDKDAAPPTAPPPGLTLTPFYKPEQQAMKRSAADAGFSRFSDHRDDNHGRHRHKHRRGERATGPPGPDQCFFCLSSSTVSTHMVISVGEEAYLATARGPLPSPTTFKDHDLTCPSHIIITTMEHAAVMNSAPLPVGLGNDADKTFNEMTRFRESIQSMIAAKSNGGLGVVTWEINRANNVHVHWQLMPVPIEMVTEGTVEAAFRVFAMDEKLGDEFVERDFHTADDLEDDIGDYLRVWIWGDISDGKADNHKVLSTSLLVRISDEDGEDHRRFDLQFPRKVMAKLLGLEDRTVWKRVVQTEDEETADVTAFRLQFKDWDFTLQK